DGKHLACRFAPQGSNGTLVVREVATGKEVFREQWGVGLLGPCYLPDGRLVTCSGNEVRVLDGRTGKVLRSWQASKVRITALAVSARGVVATGETGGREATIRLW